MVDGEDQVRMLINPTSQYAEAAGMALGRSMDDEIIAQADAVAYTGADGTTSTAYDTTMTVPVNTVWSGVTAADCGLNVRKLINARKRLGQKNVDPDDEKYCIVNAAAIESLLQDERISSADYNQVKPLVNGEVTQFAGFTMIPTERLGTDSNDDDKVLYWAKGGMLLGIGKDIMTRIGERADKGYATQAYACMSIGATRMEEARVGVILCDPSVGPAG